MRETTEDAMKNLPVHWYEGLFLRPHHLQAADRHEAEFLTTWGRWDNPYNYGLQAIEFSQEALANYQFELRTIRARMRDGTLVDLGVGNEPDRLDLRGPAREAAKISADLESAFEKENLLRVYLAVPKLKLGNPNVTQGAREEQFRYYEVHREVPDENRTGKDQEVVFRELNARLLLSTQDISGYELLPIAQIKRAGEGEARPELDSNYIPPLLSIGAWPGLGRDIVRAIFDVIGEKSDVLSQQVVGRGTGLASRDPSDVDRVALLDKLNEAYGGLAVLAFAQGVHPLIAYAELARILGRLSILTGERRTGEIPAYDHDDLARIFREIRERIEAIINAVRPYEYEQRFFVGVGMGMQVSLEPRWFHSDWQWVVGVHKGDLTQEECRNLLSAGQLDWKLGSSRQVEILFTRRAEGLRLQPVDRSLRALPLQKDWIYYEIAQSNSSAWRDVVETQTLAMRLKDSLILNRDRLQGETNLLVSAFGRQIPLQFALFAIPTRS
jgi:type VI secretion system protein ImpJ